VNAGDRYWKGRGEFKRLKVGGWEEAEISQPDGTDEKSLPPFPVRIRPGHKNRERAPLH